MIRDQEYPTPLEAELNALRELQEEAALIGPHYHTFEGRISRLEGIVDVLVKMLRIKGEFELAEVRRKLAELSH